MADKTPADSTVSPTPTVAIAPTAQVTIPAVAVIPPEQHASRLHIAFSVIQGMLDLLESPAVLALLPKQYQGYALAIASVEQVAEAIISEGTLEK